MGQLSNIKIATPTHKEVVPSTKKSIKLKPFRVGDEKALLMASQSQDTKQMINTLKEVISNCSEGVNVNELAPFDLEYLFLKLRAVSVGEITEIGLKCTHCETTNKINIDLGKVKVKEVEGHTNFIKINEDLIFEMKYPDLSEVADISTEDMDGIIDVVVKSVKNVFHGEDTIEVGSSDYDDLRSILNSLTTHQFEDIQKFFTTSPKLSHDITFKCGQCAGDNKQVLEGLTSFF